MRAILTLLLVLLITPVTASAYLKFCNNTTQNVWVAVAYGSCDKPDDLICGVRVEGWWGLPPKECKTPIGGDLSLVYYYYYAFASDGTKWAGDWPTLCVNPDDAFDYNTDDQAFKCASSHKRNFKVIMPDGHKDFIKTLED